MRQDADLMKSWFSGHTVAEIKMAFNAIDADQSGDITWAEFEQFAGA